MGASGVFGFTKNGETKLGYIGSASYPALGGLDVVKFVKENSITELNETFNKMVLVDEAVAKTPIPQMTVEEMNECIESGRPYTQLNNVKLNGLPVSEANDFINESLFCEWGYIINLDTNKLEVYEGYQKYVDEDGNEKYGKCALIHENNLTDIPENWLETLPIDENEKCVMRWY